MTDFTFSSARYPLRVADADGVVWILPDFQQWNGGADRMTLNSENRGSFTVDFLNLGKRLLELMPSDYVPGMFRSRLDKAVLDKYTEPLPDPLDFRQPFDGGPLLRDFFETYGIPRALELFGTDYGGEDKRTILRDLAKCSLPDCTLSGMEWPAVYLADYIIEIFLLSARADELSERLRGANFERVTNVSYTVTFAAGATEYERVCRVSSLLDYAALTILHDPSILVLECPNCGRVFVPANKNKGQIYCCHACQNTAAVKRSQAKKKGAVKNG